jgi:hypothetical protein
MVGSWWLVVAALGAVAAHPTSASAQQQRVYLQAAFTATTQTHSSEETRAIQQARSLLEPLGGTRSGSSLVVGIWPWAHVALEGEASFTGQYSSHYTFKPGPSSVADADVTRRDTYLSFNLRIKTGVLEPVAGLGVALANMGVRNSIAGRTYSDAAESKTEPAAAGGVDAAFRASSHLSIGPTFRALIVARPQSFSSDPLVNQTITGRVVLRYGAGARVTF